MVGDCTEGRQKPSLFFVFSIVLWLFLRLFCLFCIPGWLWLLRTASPSHRPLRRRATSALHNIRLLKTKVRVELCGMCCDDRTSNDHAAARFAPVGNNKLLKLKADCNPNSDRGEEKVLQTSGGGSGVQLILLSTVTLACIRCCALRLGQRQGARTPASPSVSLYVCHRGSAWTMVSRSDSNASKCGPNLVGDSNPAQIG